jgi:hypothetical protein
LPSLISENWSRILHFDQYFLYSIFDFQGLILGAKTFTIEGIAKKENRRKEDLLTAPKIYRQQKKTKGTAGN